VKGERKPMGSNMLLTAESKPLLVNGLSTTGAVNTNESVLRSGRMLLRKACPEGIDWDETLPDIHKDSWQTWTQNLNLLNGYVFCS
jgi:hypothetical protein